MHDGTPDVPGAEHRMVDAGEVRLHAVEMGRGPLVLLLHGFPEFWWSWRKQLPALAAAGFRAVAADLRGYNTSDRPAPASAYALPRLVADVDGLVRGLGEERAHVVGHDWGGVVAWAFAARHPGRVQRLAVLNAPHGAALRRALARPEQALRSSYMLLFQVPVVPEALLSFGDYALLRRILRALRATPVTDGELEPYVAAARRSGGLRGPLQYYRAIAPTLLRRRRGVARAPTRVDAPALVVWGERDPVFTRAVARPPPELVPRTRISWIPEGGHTVQLDAPERVSRALVDFLREVEP
jgi:epoxide hydrolase 4